MDPKSPFGPKMYSILGKIIIAVINELIIVVMNNIPN